MDKQHYNRRRFLQHSLSSGMLWLAGGLLLTSCGGAKTEKKAEEEQPASCQDYSKLSSEDLAARKKLGYTDASPDPEKFCQLCNLYKPPKEGAKCGGCLLFKGPVEAEGTCTYWAPQTS